MLLRKMLNPSWLVLAGSHVWKYDAMWKMFSFQVRLVLQNRRLKKKKVKSSAKFYTGKGFLGRASLQLNETDLFVKDVGKQIYTCKWRFGWLIWVTRGLQKPMAVFPIGAASPYVLIQVHCYFTEHTYHEKCESIVHTYISVCVYVCTF